MDVCSENQTKLKNSLWGYENPPPNHEIIKGDSKYTAPDVRDIGVTGR
jgi:hypothetical protein